MMKKIYLLWIGLLKKFFLLLVRFYQTVISPHSMPCCRFMPTCSRYAYEAYSRYGVVRGTYLTVKRLLKCHPFSKYGGYDPVPDTFCCPLWQKIKNLFCLVFKEDKTC